MTNELSPADVDHLRRSIAVAARARTNGNHPFGATLVDASGRVLFEAENTVVTEHDPIGHAETNLVRMAKDLPLETLAQCTMYASTEPCAMCAGATYWSGIGRVVYAFSSAELNTLVQDNPQNPALNVPCRAILENGRRAPIVIGPVELDGAREVHAGFWTT